jgi:hypothetical protein
VHAFIYHNGAITDLNSLIDASLGWELIYATDINDRGQIVGYGLVNGQGHAFLLSPVPEPSTAIIVGAAVLYVIASRRRSKLSFPYTSQILKPCSSEASGSRSGMNS